MNVFTKKENLKWLIITLVYVIFYGVLEAKFQFFTNMAKADIFCICYALWGLLGLICLEAIVFKSKEKLGTLSFVASLLGLLGTFLGLANAFNSIDICRNVYHDYWHLCFHSSTDIPAFSRRNP